MAQVTHDAFQLVGELIWYQARATGLSCQTLVRLEAQATESLLQADEFCAHHPLEIARAKSTFDGSANRVDNITQTARTALLNLCAKWCTHTECRRKFMGA